MSGERWFAVHTLPRKESTAVFHLMRQGFSTFLPLLSTTRRHARKQRAVLTSFFPRYVFVRLDLARDRWRTINGTVGVNSLVMTHERPSPIPEGIVEDIASRTRPDGVVDLGLDLRPGDAVRIMPGPLAGHIGTLLRLDEKGRVEILLDLLCARARGERNMLEGVH